MNIDQNATRTNMREALERLISESGSNQYDEWLGLETHYATVYFGLEITDYTTDDVREILINDDVAAAEYDAFRKHCANELAAYAEALETYLDTDDHLEFDASIRTILASLA